MDVSLKGKTAFVGGSSQGIGLAAAKELALLGATCFLTGRTESTLAQAVSALATPEAQRHRFFVMDTTNPEQVKKLAETLARENSVDILVNNTGGPKGGPIAAATVPSFEEAFRQHIACNQYLVQAFLPGMKSRGYGRIINIISTSVKTPLANLGVSNTIRLAVAAWSKTLANEMDGAAVTVNNVLPGLTETDRLNALVEASAKSEGKPAAEVAEKLRQSVPLRRFAAAAEVGAVVAFLATPAAGYVHGVNIAVDGGRTAAL